jgi:hypothetical protein
MTEPDPGPEMLLKNNKVVDSEPKNMFMFIFVPSSETFGHNS